MNRNILFTLLICLFLFDDCVYFDLKKKSTKDDRNNAVLALSLLGLLQNPNQELFLFLPSDSRNLTNAQYVEAVLTTPTVKPKLILIHGWNPLERDTDPFTSRSQKIANVNGTYSNAIIHFQENQGLAKDKFDLYLFTYRTSNSILANGQGFLSKIRQHFKSSDRVYVVAHSMGGLVTRAAMKSNLYEKGMIDGVITLASPIYGSPFASKKYITKITFANELASFLTETQGGINLGYTNEGTNQIPIEDEKNTTLDHINNSFPYNAIFVTFSGVLNQNCTGAETFFYGTGCNILSSSLPSFTLNDGIVPENSAFIGNLGLRNFRKAGYDHSMMAMQTKNIDDTKSSVFFKEILIQVDLLLSQNIR